MGNWGGGRDTLLLHAKSVGGLGILICCILPFLRLATEERETATGSLGGFVCFLEQGSGVLCHIEMGSLGGCGDESFRLSFVDTVGRGIQASFASVFVVDGNKYYCSSLWI